MRKIELILKDEKTEETVFTTQLFGMDFSDKFFFNELKETFGIESYHHCFPETKVDFQSLFIIIEKTIANMITENKTRLVDREGCSNIYLNPIMSLTNYVVKPVDKFTMYREPKESVSVDVGPLSLEGLIEGCDHCLFGMSDNIPMLRNGVVAYIVSL